MTSRETLPKLSEDELRRQVLVPLFKAMAFRDVTVNHGVTELGKDIVMWKPDELMVRVNYAVVAKKGPITGKVGGGTSSASATSEQIRQSFGAPFSDPVSGRSQAVGSCWVVASGAIKQQTRDAIMAALSPSITANNVRFIDGEQLADLVEKFLPHLTLVDRLDDIRDTVRKVAPDYRIDTTIGDSGVTTFTIRPRRPDADAEEMSFSAKIVLPNDELGRATHEALSAHWLSGSPVRVPGQFIKDFRVPDVIRLLAGSDVAELHELRLGPRRTDSHLDMNFTASSRDGSRAQIGPIRFVVSHAGAESATLDTDPSVAGWLGRIVMRFASQSADLELTPKLLGVNVRVELDALRFLAALRAGGLVELADASTGLLVGKIDLAPNTTPEVPHDVLEFLERVLRIHELSGVAISVPNRTISANELNHIFDTADVLENPTRTMTWDAATIPSDRQLATNLLRVVNNEPVALSELRRERRIVLGQEINFGQRHITFVCSMDQPDREALAHALAQEGDGPFQVRVRRAGSTDATVSYPDIIKRREGRESGQA
jgi:hypothetical protein